MAEIINFIDVTKKKGIAELNEKIEVITIIGSPGFVVHYILNLNLKFVSALCSDRTLTIDRATSWKCIFLSQMIWSLI